VVGEVNFTFSTEILLPPPRKCGTIFDEVINFHPVLMLVRCELAAR